MKNKKTLYCKSIFSQARGLMFRSKRNLVMKFPSEKKISLHMFFVFYPIDVLVLDSERKIIEIKRNFKPFTFWNSKRKGKYIIETPLLGQYQLGKKMELPRPQF